MIRKFSTSSIPESALEYASFGWRVFPVHSIRDDGRCTCRKGWQCSTPGKHPRTRNGFKDATVDAAKIREWFSKWPESNIGIATGADSAIVVVDVDRHEGGPDGVEQLREIARAVGRLPAGPYAETGGGGYHFVFAYPGPTRKHPRRNGTTFEGIDLQGDGSYIVAPPSVHASGRIYRWKVPPTELETPELPPEWLPLLLQGKDATEKPPDLDSKDPSETPKNDTPLIGRERPFIVSKGSYGLKGSKGFKAVTRGQPQQVGGDRPTDGKDLETRIFEAISATVPRSQGQRHAGIFAFARCLKINLGLSERDPGDFADYVRIWHDKAKPHISSEIDFEGEMLEFVDGWESARHAVGGFLGWCVARVREHPPAVPMAVQRRGSKRVADLAKLCAVMERYKDGATFYIPTTSREIHAYLGMEDFGEALARTQTNSAIRVLIAAGVLDKVRQGSRSAGASHYRYLALEESYPGIDLPGE